MENLKKEFQSRLLETKREGVENVIKHLDRLGFFVAPASTKFHLNVKGGLMQHSWNVCNTALMLREQMIQMKPELEGKLPVDSIIIASLLHDACKANIYKETERMIKAFGRRSQDTRWTIQVFHSVMERSQ